MRSKCKRPIAERKRQSPALVISLLLSLITIGTATAYAQDGTKLPPPPKVNAHSDDVPDPDFQSPLRQQNGQQQMFGGGANGELAAEIRRRRRLRQEAARAKMNEEGGDAASGGGTGGGGGFGGRFGGQGLGGRFAGQGFGGQGFGGQGFGGQRFGGQGFGAGGGQGGLGGQGRRGPGMPMGMLGGKRALDLTPLNLTEEQKQRIRQQRISTREHAKEIRLALQEKQRNLRAMLFSPDATDSQIRQARRAVRETQDQLDDINMNDLLGIRSVLTAEQRRRLPEIMPHPGGPGGARGGPAEAFGGPNGPGGPGGPGARMWRMRQQGNNGVPGETAPGR